MTYRVEVTPEFERDLARFAPETARRILRKIDWLAARPEAIPAPMKHLPRDLAGLRKYRVGTTVSSSGSAPPDTFLPSTAWSTGARRIGIFDAHPA